MTALAFSRDGDQLAGALQGWGNPVNLLWAGLKGIWEKPPEELRLLGDRLFTPSGLREMFDVRCLAFSPDGKRIAMGRLTGGAERQKTAYIAEVPVGDAKPEKPRELELYSTVFAVAWTPDGQQVVATGLDGRKSAVAVWSAADGSKVRQLGLRSLGNRRMDGYSSGQTTHFWTAGGCCSPGRTTVPSGSLRQRALQGATSDRVAPAGRWPSRSPGAEPVRAQGVRARPGEGRRQVLDCDAGAGRPQAQRAGTRAGHLQPSG